MIIKELSTLLIEISLKSICVKQNKTLFVKHTKNILFETLYSKYDKEQAQVENNYWMFNRFVIIINVLILN